MTLAPVKTVLLTIDDPVYLPAVFTPLFDSPRVELQLIILIPPLQALNMHPGGTLGWQALRRRLGMYGPAALARMALRHAFARPCGLRALAHMHRVPILIWSGSVNDPALLAKLEELAPEIILGVFSEKAGARLRGLALNGLLLLHYAYLPDFAGREPVFWCLLEQPEAGGVSFFEPDDQFDRGRIAARHRIDLSHCRSLHQGIQQLGAAAAQLVLDAVTAAPSSRQPLPSGTPMVLRRFPDPAARRRFLQKGLRFT